jgi:hypothetical protein
VCNNDFFATSMSSLHLSQKRTISPLINDAYRLYSGGPVGGQDKPLSAHVRCSVYAVNLTDLINGARHSPPLAVPVTLMEPKDHISD